MASCPIGRIGLSVFLSLLLGSAAFAATRTNLTGDRASLNFTTKSSYASLKPKLDQIVLGNIRSLPFVRNAEVFHKKKLKPDPLTGAKGEVWYLIIYPINRRILQDSIFRVIKAEIAAGGPLGMPAMTQYALRGPVASDELLVSELKPEWLEKSFGFQLTVTEGMGNSCPAPAKTSTDKKPAKKKVPVAPQPAAVMSSMGVMAPSPGSGETAVEYSVQIENMAYQKYLERLAKQKILQSLPTQENLLRAVLFQFFGFQKSYGEGRGS